MENTDSIELYYKMVSVGWQLASRCIVAYCYCWLVKPFMINKKRIWTIGAAYIIVLLILEYIPYYTTNFKAYSCGVMSGFFMMYLIDRKCEEKKIFQKLFLAVTFFSLRWISFAMDGCILNGVANLTYILIGADKGMEVWMAAFAVEVLIDIVISSTLMFGSVWIIQKAYIYKDQNLTKSEFILLLVPMLSVALGYSIKKFYENVYQMDAGKDILDEYSNYNVICFFYYAFLLATILVVIILFQKIKKSQEEEYSNEQYLGQIEDMKRRIGEVEGFYSDIRSLKHDIGNHIMTLESLYKRNEYDEAARYMEQLKIKFNSAPSGIKSSNPVTDVILTQAQKQAQEKQIEFICDFHYPETIDGDTKINAFDLSIILNNALTNAIEGAAACNNPYIKIISYRKNNSFMLEVKNRFDGELIYNERTKLPRTTKQDIKRHGFGLENIRKTAQKYFGDIDITIDNGEFMLTVMLMLQ